MTKAQTKAERVARRKQQRRQQSILMVALGSLVLLALGAVLFKQLLPKPKAEIEVTGAPSLKVDQEKIEMGDIKLGRTVSASFTLTNVGDQPLRITENPYIEVIEGC